MDTLYVGDIPLNFKYAQINNGYIRLFDKPSARNETLTYYQVYTSQNGFYYSTGTQTFNNTNTTYFTEIPVSNNIVYRQDIDSIFVMSFILVIFGLWLLNLISSCIRKGGVLGGLF